MARRRQGFAPTTLPHSLARWPRIRVLDQDAIAIMGDGNTSTMLSLDHESPMVILNPDELNWPACSALISSGFYKSLYGNPRPYEHQMEYEKQTDFISGEALAARRKALFISTRPSATLDEWHYYDSAPPGERSKRLMRMYERDRRLILWKDALTGAKKAHAEEVLTLPEKIAARDEALVERMRYLPREKLLALQQHGVDILSVAPHAQEDNARLVAAIEKLPPDWLKRLQVEHRIEITQPEGSGRLSGRINSPKVKEELRRKLDSVLEKVPEDLLILANDAGLNIVLAKQMKYIDSNEAARGISFALSEMIKLSEKALVNPLVVQEEFFHYVDSLEGLSCRKEWVDAIYADTKNPDSSACKMLDILAKLGDKSSLFDRRVYQENALGEEALADLNKADAAWKDALEKLDGELRDDTDYKPLKRIVDKHQGDKEKTMKALFPKSWPLYKEFMTHIHERAEQIRSEGKGTPGEKTSWVAQVGESGHAASQEPPAAWTDRTAKPDNSSRATDK